MSFKLRIVAAAAAIALASPLFAEGIMVNDPYARVSTKMSASGAAFMMIHNDTGTADRLVAARSDVAERVELHTHIEVANGVMKMMHVEDGFELPEGGMIEMKRGGHHIMFLGLKQPLAHGDKVAVTLVFEKAGEVAVEVPVDLERKPMQGQMQHNHGQMKQETN
jgi:copper(I)-binding protein